MNRCASRRVVPALALGVVFATGASAQQAPPPTPAASPPTAPGAAAPAPAKPVLEPKALEILKASGAKLAAARSMSFTAVASYESPSLPGPALVYSTMSQVTVQR